MKSVDVYKIGPIVIKERLIEYTIDYSESNNISKVAFLLLVSELIT